MIYSKNKTKDEILSLYLQNKANKFVTSGLFKQYSSANTFQNKVKKLETENKKLVKSLEMSNHKLRSFCMKLVQALGKLQNAISNLYIIFEKELVKAQSKLCNHKFAILIQDIKLGLEKLKEFLK
ncbi:21752_t:CDS:2 [Cetraspora pellucida]|uniref:21752_t:CDS:1 n=1 Tax=Cetraspora pellucida TaxID=1433469 RepID=A0A9N9NCK8_9GLOM|nr:21752_t:CDS:2 [Cetraspora pellucida]